MSLSAAVRRPAVLSLQKNLFALRRCIHASTAAKPATASAGTDLQPKSRDYLNLSASSLSYHWDTIPPTADQLRYAHKFFTKQPPAFLWSAPKFQSMRFGDSPEVCFLGRSNVGKSSILNALLGRKIAHTSSRPGRTQSMNAFAVGGEEDNGRNRLVVLDMPGYGKGGRAEWGKEIMKYLGKRKQLKRSFLLIDTEHGIKESDKQLISMFRQQDIPHQIVLSKVDKFLFPSARLPSKHAFDNRMSRLRRIMETCQQEIQPQFEDEGGALGELIACSAEKKISGTQLGIDAVRHAMLQAAGLEYHPPRQERKPIEIVPHELVFG